MIALLFFLVAVEQRTGFLTVNQKVPSYFTSQNPIKILPNFEFVTSFLHPCGVRLFYIFTLFFSHTHKFM